MPEPFELSPASKVKTASIACSPISTSKARLSKLESLSLTVSLGSALKPSDRFRMDIDSAEDINIKVEGRSYEISYSFPMKGAYMTVSKNRQWGPYKSKKDK